MILTSLIILLGIVLAVVYFNRDKNEEKARIGILSLTTAIVILVVTHFITSDGGSALTHHDTTLDEEIGAVAAEWIAEMAMADSAVIIVPAHQRTAYVTARLKGFEEGLAMRNVKLLGIEGIGVEGGAGGRGEEFDARAIKAAMEQHPGVGMVISLAGFPALHFDEIAPVLQDVEFYIFEGYRPDGWSKYLHDGVVDGIILQPRDSEWMDRSGSAEEIFARSYIFVTPESFEELRSRLDFE